MIKILDPYIILQCLLFGLALILKRQSDNRYLGLFFLLTGLQYALYELQVYTLIESKKVVITFFMDWIGYFKLPVLIKYFSLLHLKKVSPWQYLYSLLLFPATTLFPFLIVTGSNPYSQMIDYVFSSFYISSNLLANFSVIVILIFPLRKIHAALNDPASSYSHYQRIKMFWAKWLIYFAWIKSTASILFVASLAIYASPASISPIVNYYGDFTTLLLIILLLIIGYLSLRNPAVFNEPEKTGSLEQKLAEMVLPENEKVLTKKPSLSEALTETYIHNLKQVVEEQKAYLDNELDQIKLSKLTHIPRQHLSYLINKHFNRNFQDFINSYRVAHAKALLKDTQRSGDIIYTIAMESGFNSERTFYTVFKQSTGFTPKQFKTFISQNN